MVDHKNGDAFDNRRENLRFATETENHLNLHKSRPSRSAYRGVHYRKLSNTWRLSMRVNYTELALFNAWRSRHVAAMFMDEQLETIVGPFVMKNFARSIRPCDLRSFIESATGRIFRVVFSKRSTGEQREMVCRTGVARRLTGKGMAFEPVDKNLLVVYDMQVRGYRCIPLDRVLCLAVGKVNYRIEGNHESKTAKNQMGGLTSSSFPASTVHSSTRKPRS